jgi:hypothetical protein
MAKFTTSSGPSKVRSKAPQDKPPFAHKSGRWAKKVRGRSAYLGAIDAVGKPS